MTTRDGRSLLRFSVSRHEAEPPSESPTIDDARRHPLSWMFGLSVALLFSVILWSALWLAVRAFVALI